MYKRLLIVARDSNQANHWSKDQRMSPGAWVYVSSFHNIRGNAGTEYVKLPGWDTRPDADVIQAELKTNSCKERNDGRELSPESSKVGQEHDRPGSSDEI